MQDSPYQEIVDHLMDMKIAALRYIEWELHEDCVHDCIVAAIQKWDQPIYGNRKHWLCGFTRYRALMMYRTISRRRCWEQFEYWWIYDRGTPEKLAWESESVSIMGRVMKKLKPEYADVLIRWAEGSTTAQEYRLIENAKRNARILLKRELSPSQKR